MAHWHAGQGLAGTSGLVASRSRCDESARGQRAFPDGPDDALAEKESEFMPRIRPVEYEEATPAVRAAHDEVVHEHGRITNMKRTLLHSLPAFHALMEWYALRDTVQPFLGDRLTNLFAHAISSENDCLVCSTLALVNGASLGEATRTPQGHEPTTAGCPRQADPLAERRAS